MKLTQLEKVAIHGDVLRSALQGRSVTDLAQPINSGILSELLRSTKKIADQYINVMEEDSVEDTSHPNDQNGH